MADAGGNRFSSLLLEGLDFYRRGRMLDAVRSWEEAYLLEPTNLRAREFLRSALERIHARMSSSQGGTSAQPGVAFSDMQQFAPRVPLEALSGPGLAFRSFDHHPWLRAPDSSAGGSNPGLKSPSGSGKAKAPIHPAAKRTPLPPIAPAIAPGTGRETGEEDEVDDLPALIEDVPPPPPSRPPYPGPNPSAAPAVAKRETPSGRYSFKPEPSGTSPSSAMSGRASESLPTAPRAAPPSAPAFTERSFANRAPAPTAAKSAGPIQPSPLERANAAAQKFAQSAQPNSPASPPEDAQAKRAALEKNLQTDALSLDLLRTDEHAHAQMLASADPTARKTPSPPGAKKSAPKKSKVASPWDDGPSIALPQSDPPPDKAASVWPMHGAPVQKPPATPDETMIWMTAAGELMALDDFTGALELVNKVLARHPDHAQALQTRDICEHNLIQMYESRLGGVARRPKVVLGPDEVIWLNLDPRAGFVLAQIDGEVSFEDLYAICGLTRLDTARILSQLLSEGVVAAEGEANHLF